MAIQMTTLDSLVGVLVFAIIVAVEVSCGLDDSCSTDNVNVTSCLRPVVALESLGLGVYTAEQLQTVCNNVTETSTCLARYGCDDSPGLTERWAGVKQGFSYLCKEGKRAYLRNGACLQSQSVQAEMTACSQAMKNSNKEQCLTANIWVMCMKNSTSSCPQDATNVFHQYTVKRLQPAMGGCVLKIHSDEVEENSAVKRHDMIVIVPFVLTLLARLGAVIEMP